MSTLMMHAGGCEVCFDRLIETPTPEPTESWYPVPHAELVRLVRNGLDAYGIEVESERFGLRGNDEFFGLFNLRSGMSDAWDVSLGLRNSHNKRFPASLALGQHVFVCDNMAFSAEVSLARRHTRNIMRDLPGLTCRAIDALTAARGKLVERTDRYAAMPMNDEQVDHLIVTASLAGAVPNQYVGDIANEWRKPRHVEFAPRTLWSAYNAFTEIMKASPSSLQKRTLILSGMCDGLVGLN